ncbi:MAG: bifunctional DNA primase/polymerase [Chloroflexi bacterium]|nr:bifunctional DNA primase/polymerase [Chloroflexota bacterium]
MTHPAYSAALHCVERGWSVIPLIGGDDPARGKTPAAAWSRYRERLPSAEELRQWFESGKHSAYGIVCGNCRSSSCWTLTTKPSPSSSAGAFPTSRRR